MRGIIALLLVLPLVHAALLVGSNCPGSVYAGEVYGCSYYVFNSSGADVPVNYYVHGQAGKVSVLESAEGNFELVGYGQEEINVTLWAKEVGTELVLFEYGAGGLEYVHGTPLAVVAPPLGVELVKSSLEAGKRGEVTLRFTGSASFVDVNVLLPPGFQGERKKYVGDVTGEKTVALELSPDPFVYGEHAVTLEIRFMDATGKHVLRKEIVVDVSPPVYVYAGAALVAAVLIAGIYLWRKKRKEGQ